MRWAILGLVAALAPATAYADLPTSSLGGDAVLTLDLVGRVPGHCGFAQQPPSAVELGDLAKAGSVVIPFRLDCNSNFAITVASAHGGLQQDAGMMRAAPPAAGAGFADRIDYDLAVQVDTDDGAIASRCAASALAKGGACGMAATGAAGGLSSDGGVAIDRDGGVVLTWAAPTGRLVAGRYSDTVTITVEART